MSNPIKNRYDFVYLYDVKDGNPNGDPDQANLPRADAENQEGIVTDVCIKRKVRNYIMLKHELNVPHDIFIRQDTILNKIIDSVKGEKPQDRQKELCKAYYDIRTFGAVMALKSAPNCGQVRGPVQLTFARSVDPVVSLEHSITRMAVATEAEAEKQGGDNRTMGRKFTIPYGLYRAHGFISAPLANQTGFSAEDLELFWDALLNMFEHDRSAARGLMGTRKLIVFKHASKMGNVPVQKLFDTISIKKLNKNKPARDFSDYEISIAKGEIPEGVEVLELL